MKVFEKYEVWIDKYGSGPEFDQSFTSKREAIKFAKSVLPAEAELFDDEYWEASVYELTHVESFVVKPKKAKK